MTEGIDRTTLFARLATWQRVLFALLWPVSIPYAAVGVWKSKNLPRSTRLVLTAAAVTALALLTTASVIVVSALAHRTPDRFDPGPRTIIQAVVVRVVDGDTAVFRLEDGSDETVRFIGVDTPESTQRTEPYGEQAAEFTKNALGKGMTVYLEQDIEPRDRYGRLLAYVWIAEPGDATDDEIRQKMFNAHLLLNGYGQQMTVQPNSKYADFFTTYVSEARAADKGLWSPKIAEQIETTRSPEAATEGTGPSAIPTVAYIGNRRSRKFHRPECVSVTEMKPKNKIPLPSREAAIEARFIPCGKCDP